MSIQYTALHQPGALYQAGMDEMAKYLGARGGAIAGSNTPDKVVTFLTSIFHGSHPIKECGVRNARELRTLAMALDSLGAGSLPQLADLLMQRFKAVQSSITDNSWNLAKRLELIPEDGLSLTTFEERRAAARDEVMTRKLEEAMSKSKK